MALLSNVAKAHPGHEKLMRLKPRPFLKLDTEKKNGELLTAYSILQDGDISVQVIGVLQISRKDYIKKVSKLTRGYDVVMVESIGHSSTGETSPLLKTLHKNYLAQADRWKLKPTLPLKLGKTPLVLADFNLKGYTALSKTQQRSVLADGLTELKSPALLARALTQENPSTQAFTGHTAFDAQRTDVLIQTLHRQLIAGKKKICIVVGVSRAPAVELRLRRQNFHLNSTAWLTAWNL